MHSGPTSNSNTPNSDTKTRANSSVPPCAPCGESFPDAQNTKPTQPSEAVPTSAARSLTPNSAADQQPKINSPSSSLDEVKARARRVISNIRNILLTSPMFPRLYADVILHCAPNSREAKILRSHYQKICEKVNAMSNSNGTCTHIKISGVRCGSPALRGEQFCYFHQNAHRGVRRPQQSRLHPIALIEDEESIQYALMEVINALMRNTIDLKRATLILRALHIAVKNAPRVKFGIQEPVTKIPEYAPPTEQHEAIAQQSELPAVSAIPYKPVEPTNPHFWEYSEEGARVLAREAQATSTDRVGTDRVGTGAFARPAQAKPSASVATDAEAGAERSRSIRPASAAT